MTNHQLHNYRPIPLSDTHMHYLYAKRAEESAEIFKSFIDFFGLESITLLGLIDGSGHRRFEASSTATGLYLKSVLNSYKPHSAYIYGSPIHFYDERDTADGYLAQVTEMYEMGVDGYKLLDGKPARRKALGRPLSDMLYDKMYSFIEEMGMPVKIHMNDPRMYWGPRETMTPLAIQRGWWCGDGTYPDFEQVYEELETVLARHPRLKLCIAHMGYLTDDYPHAVRLMESFENLTFDLTPGAVTFESFTREPELWRGFVEKYYRRIFVGSDTYNQYEDGDDLTTMAKTGYRMNLVLQMMERTPDRVIDHPTYGPLTPMNFPDHILERIYHRNVRELLGEGREINSAAVVRHAEMKLWEIEGGKYPTPECEKQIELENLRCIIEHFG